MHEFREDFISWKQYYMMLALLSGLKGDGGACLINPDNRLLSVGYGGIPLSIKKTLTKTQMMSLGDSLPVLSPISNMLCNFTGNMSNLKNGSLFVSKYFDCDAATKLASSRISNIYYLVRENNDARTLIAEKIVKDAGITIEPYSNNRDYSIDDSNEFSVKLLKLIKGFIGNNSYNYLTDDEYFMAVSLLSALRSKDPSTQVGCCLVDPDGTILSMGYNGLPFGTSNHTYPWASNGEKTNNIFEIKDHAILHAEVNAVANYSGDQFNLKGCKCYVTFSPCKSCTTVLAAKKLGDITYLINYSNSESFQRSKLLFNSLDVGFNQYTSCSSEGLIKSNYTKPETREFFEELTGLIGSFLGKDEKNYQKVMYGYR